ncbi:MAG TPA: homoserine O-acetyltransferase [Acidimicrobiia bacterium]|nr:homoserine O-acetyltransferase [Acidimicrobiia bacterium]
MDLPPASGAWRPGDPVGARHFETLFDARPHVLEAGGRLEHVTVAYETWGTLDPGGANAVLVLHALTGDSHAAGRDGWWDPVIGPGAPIDTNRWFVVCPNVLGGCQGTTGPASPSADGLPYGSRFPILTIRDQAVVEAALADRLGIDRWAAVVGGSMGGMRALEWIVAFPERVERAVVVSVGAKATAEQIAWGSMQIRAIQADPRWRGGDYYDAPDGEGPQVGLEIARGIGQISYRSELEFDARFGRDHQGDEDPLDGGRYAVESYLEYHGAKLTRRFDANTYLALSRAMNHHDIGRGRGGVETALTRVRAEVAVAGISSDRLYPLRLQHALAAALPNATDVEIIQSPCGHDGFLVESEAVGKVIRRALA